MDFFSACLGEDQVKETYRKLAMAFHPDRGGDPALMKELQKQYEFWAKNSESRKDERKPYFNSSWPGSTQNYEGSRSRTNTDSGERLAQERCRFLEGRNRQLQGENHAHVQQIIQDGFRIDNLKVEIEQLKKKLRKFEVKEKKIVEPKKSKVNPKKSTVIHL